MDIRTFIEKYDYNVQYQTVKVFGVVLVRILIKNSFIYFRVNDFCKLINKDWGEVFRDKNGKPSGLKKKVYEIQQRHQFETEIVKDGSNDNKGKYYHEVIILDILREFDYYNKLFDDIQKKQIEELQNKLQQVQQQIQPQIQQEIQQETQQEIQQNSILKDEQLYMQMQVQQQQIPLLCDFIKNGLKAKKYDQQMINIFTDQVNGYKKWIDFDEYKNVLEYNENRNLNKVIEKGVLNQDYTFVQLNEAPDVILDINTDNKLKTKKYRITTEFFLKILCGRLKDDISPELRNNINIYIGFLQDIFKLATDYSKLQIQQQQIQIEDISDNQLEDESEEELKQDSEGNLHNHNGKIIQHNQEQASNNQQLQVIQEQIYDLDDMTLVQLYKMMGKLECMNIPEKQKKLYNKLLELRIQILTKENEAELEKKNTELEKKNNEIELEKKNTELEKKNTQIELEKSKTQLEKKNNELLQEKLNNKNNELIIKDLQHEKEMLESEQTTDVKWGCYLIFINANFEIYRSKYFDYLIEKKEQCQSKGIRFDDADYQEEFYEKHKDQIKKDIEIINAAPSTVDISKKPIYAGIAKHTRLLIRPYEHILEIIKYCSLQDELNDKRCICFAKLLKKYKQLIQILVSIKIYKLHKSEDEIRLYEKDLITQCLNNYLTNVQNYHKYKDGRIHKKICTYAKEFELFNV